MMGICCGRWCCDVMLPRPSLIVHLRLFNRNCHRYFLIGCKSLWLHNLCNRCSTLLHIHYPCPTENQIRALASSFMINFMLSAGLHYEICNYRFIGHLRLLCFAFSQRGGQILLQMRHHRRLRHTWWLCWWNHNRKGDLSLQKPWLLCKLHIVLALRTLLFKGVYG